MHINTDRHKGSSEQIVARPWVEIGCWIAFAAMLCVMCNPAFGGQQKVYPEAARSVPRSPQISSPTTKLSTTTSRSVNSAFTEPYRVIELAAAAPGRIDSIHIRRGTLVRKGELLAELEASSLQALRKIADQKANSTARRDAMRVEHQQKLHRLQALQAISREGGGTPEEILDAESDAKIAELNVQAADEELQRARLEVEEIDTRIEQHRVRAKMDGIIIDVHCEEGEYVSSVEPKVATLVDVSRLRVSFFVPTETALSHRVGTQVKVGFAKNDHIANAEVEYVGPLTHSDSGRVRVDVLLDNSKGKFRSGMRCFLKEAIPPKQI